MAKETADKNVKTSNKKSEVKKPKKVEAPEEVVTPVVEANTEDKINNTLNRELKKTDIQWIAAIIIGLVILVSGIFIGMKMVSDGLNKSSSSMGISQEQYLLLKQGFDMGYAEGYNQGLNDAMYGGGQMSPIDPCSYEYMLENGMQEGCMYVPSNESIQPVTPMDSGNVKQNYMQNGTSSR